MGFWAHSGALGPGPRIGPPTTVDRGNMGFWAHIRPLGPWGPVYGPFYRGNRPKSTFFPNWASGTGPQGPRGPQGPLSMDFIMNPKDALVVRGPRGPFGQYGRFYA